MTAGVVDNIVYVLGGYVQEDFEDHPSTSILAYNIVTNSWTTKAAVFDGEETNGAVEIGSRLYISGGDNHSTGALTSALFAYNPTTDRKVRKANMPRRTGRGVSGVINGKLYVLPSICIVGGVRAACRFLYRYDPASDTWTTLAKAPTSHYPRALGGVIGGKLYVTGGGTNPTNRKRLDVYNPGTNTWTQLAPYPGADQVAAGVVNGQLYVINSPGLETYAYNPQTNTWAIKAPYPRLDLNTSGPKAMLKVTLNGVGRIIAVGGIQFDNTDQANHQAPSQMFTP
jgi:kelch-like protein 2/3